MKCPLCGNFLLQNPHKKNISCSVMVPGTFIPHYYHNHFLNNCYVEHARVWLYHICSYHYIDGSTDSDIWISSKSDSGVLETKVIKEKLPYIRLDLPEEDFLKKIKLYTLFA